MSTKRDVAGSIVRVLEYLSVACIALGMMVGGETRSLVGFPADQSSLEFAGVMGLPTLALFLVGDWLTRRKPRTPQRDPGLP